MATYPGGLTVEASEYHYEADTRVCYLATATATYSATYGNSDTYNVTVTRMNAYTSVSETLTVTVPTVNGLTAMAAYVDRIVKEDRIPLKYDNTNTVYVGAPIGQAATYLKYGWTYNV